MIFDYEYESQNMGAHVGGINSKIYITHVNIILCFSQSRLMLDAGRGKSLVFHSRNQL